MRLNRNVKAYINTKLGLLLVFRLASSVGPVCWISMGIFDKYLQRKKQQVTHMNLKTHGLLLFSICYTNHSQIWFINLLYALLFKNNFLENLVVNSVLKVKGQSVPYTFLQYYIRYVSVNLLFSMNNRTSNLKWRNKTHEKIQ